MFDISTTKNRNKAAELLLIDIGKLVWDSNTENCHFRLILLCVLAKQELKLNSVALVLKRTTPTDGRS
jgi:hypothetical protein